MITRKVKMIRTKCEQFIKDMIGSVISSISISDVYFLDEIYSTLESKLNTIRKFGKVDIPLIRDTDIVEPSIYNKMAYQVKENSSFAMVTLPEMYSELNNINLDVMNMAEEMNTTFSNCDDMILQAEAYLKRKIALASVKDEVTIYDSFGYNSMFSTGSLSIDKRSGSLMLMTGESETIEYTIDSIKVNKDKGSISKPHDKNNTLDFVKNGYFFSRTFATSPAFETDTDTDVAKLSDGRNDSTYSLEYNSFSQDESLEVTITVVPKTQAVDIVNLILDRGDSNAVVSAHYCPVDLVSFQTLKSGNIIEHSERLTDNRIFIKGVAIGEKELSIAMSRDDTTPVASYYIPDKSAEKITITLVSKVPQTIFYPEKVVIGDSGNIIHRFNYFETLILNRYEPPYLRLDPKSFYSRDDMEKAEKIYQSASSSYDDHILMYRYHVSVKELELKRLSFIASGESISENLNKSERYIGSVELYVNEYIPSGTSIKYMISADQKSWYDIDPMTRNSISSSDIPSRIIYEGLEPKSNDKLISIHAKKVFLKVIMSGGVNTPVLKAYSVRIKLI